MKILIVAGHAESLLNFRRELILAMIAAGHQVHVGAPGLSLDSCLFKSLSAIGVVVHSVQLDRTGLNPLSDVCAFRRLVSLMRQILPDIVFCYTIKPVIYGTLAAWMVRVPHRYALITGLGYAFTGTVNGFGLRRLINWVALTLYRLSLHRAHKIFFQNRDDQNFFLSAGLIPQAAQSLVVNGSGVDIRGFSESPLLVGEVRFLLIARLLGDKGVREYAHAAQRVRKRYPNVQFDLAGWIDNNPDAIDQNEVDDWVRVGTLNFLGRLTDVRPAIANCTVYVLPSYREGTPRTVLEAMAMGRPIITTDAPGCRETVVEGENGFLVPIKSVDALVEAMFRFVQQPDLAIHMGRRSRQIAVEKYDVGKVNAVLLREMRIIE